MNQSSNPPPHEAPSPFWRYVRIAIAALIVCAAFDWGLVTLARAAAPLAGSTIGNQASATYTDSSNTSHTATSNVTLTVVQQGRELNLELRPGQGRITRGPGDFPAYSH